MADLVFKYCWDGDWTDKNKVIVTDSRYAQMGLFKGAHVRGASVISTVKIPSGRKRKISEVNTRDSDAANEDDDEIIDTTNINKANFSVHETRRKVCSSSRSRLGKTGTTFCASPDHSREKNDEARRPSME